MAVWTTVAITVAMWLVAVLDMLDGFATLYRLRGCGYRWGDYTRSRTILFQQRIQCRLWEMAAVVWALYFFVCGGFWVAGTFCGVYL